MTTDQDAPPPGIARGWQGPSGRSRLAIGVGANLRRRRRRQGLSQAALAAAVGRDRSTISRWESGERLPNLASLVALGRALRCDPAALLPQAKAGVRTGSAAGEG